MWEQLDDGQRDVFSYFWPRTRGQDIQEVRCGCQRWPTPVEGIEVCPIIAAQVRAYSAEVRVLADHDHPSVFVPEPIRGDPSGKRILFLGINPGMSKDAAGQRVELTTCMNTVMPEHATDLASSEAYTKQHLASHLVPCDAATRLRFVAGFRPDKLTRYAVSLNRWILDNTEPESLRFPVTPHEHFGEQLKRLAVLNVAHCKSPGWRKTEEQKFGPEEVVRIFAGCGRQTFKAIKAWHPEVVIALGKPTRSWFVWLWKQNPTWVVHNTHDGAVIEQQDVSDASMDEVLSLELLTEHHAHRFVMGRHASRTSWKNARAVVRAAQDILGISGG